MSHHHFLEGQRLFLACFCIEAHFVLQQEVNCILLLVAGLGSWPEVDVNGPARLLAGLCCLDGIVSLVGFFGQPQVYLLEEVVVLGLADGVALDNGVEVLKYE